MGEYNNIQSNFTYSKANFCKDDIIKNNENYCQTFDLKLTDKDRSLPIMYWLPQLHKTPIGARSTTASKNFSTKSLSGVISKSFRMLFKRVENLHNKSALYSSYKNSGLWRIPNSLTLEKGLKKIPRMILALYVPQYPIIY